jgi:hypothetical protein
MKKHEGMNPLGGYWYEDCQLEGTVQRLMTPLGTARSRRCTKLLNFCLSLGRKKNENDRPQESVGLFDIGRGLVAYDP